MVKNLVKSAPAGARAAWTDFGRFGADYLQKLAPATRDKAVQELQTAMINDPRGWDIKVSEVQTFTAAKTAEERFSSLQSLLRGPAGDGYNMLAKVKTMRDLSLALARTSEDAAPWMKGYDYVDKDGKTVHVERANWFNGNVIVPQRGATFMAHDGGHSIEESLWAFINSASGRFAVAPAGSRGANSLERFREIAQQDPETAELFALSWDQLADFLSTYKA